MYVFDEETKEDRRSNGDLLRISAEKFVEDFCSSLKL